MNFLLVAINAKYIHSNPAVFSLKAYAKDFSDSTTISEYTINHNIDDILKDIYKQRPDAIGFSCYIWNINYIEDLITDLHKILPEVPIWLGGPEVSFDAVERLERFPFLKGIMVGEGERSFNDLMNYYVTKEIVLSDIKSIVYRNDEQKICQNPMSDVMNMSDIPFIYGNLVDYSYDNHNSSLDSSSLSAPSSSLNSSNSNLAVPSSSLNSSNSNSTAPSSSLDSSSSTASSSSLDSSTSDYTYSSPSLDSSNSTVPSSSLNNSKYDYTYSSSSLNSSSNSTVPSSSLDSSSSDFSINNLLPVFKNRIVYYESSRGCPFNCSYCLSSVDKQVRFRDLSLVLKELDFFLKQKVPQVKFVDRTFNCKKSHEMGIWNFLLEHDNGITNFHFEISADLIKAEELELLKKLRPGYIQLEIGVQSTNPATIKAINRTASFEEISAVVRQINSFQNIHQHLDLIAGLPYEDYERFKISFNDVYALAPEQLQLGFLKVLKGSSMHEKALEYGIVYKSKPPYEVLYTNWMSYDDILKLKDIEEMVEVYYNSGQFRTTLKYLVKQFKTPFELYEILAKFYASNGLFDCSHSRIARYNILLDFIKEYFYDKVTYFESLMVYDLYLRENVKTRPNFAKSQSEYKDRIRDFFDTESKNHKYLNDGYKEYSGKQLMHMSHLEIFDVNIESLIADTPDEQKYQKTEYAVLFDYKHRNPLTYDATTHIIKI